MMCMSKRLIVPLPVSVSCIVDICLKCVDMTPPSLVASSNVPNATNSAGCKEEIYEHLNLNGQPTHAKTMLMCTFNSLIVLRAAARALDQPNLRAIRQDMVCRPRLLLTRNIFNILKDKAMFLKQVWIESMR